MTVDIAALRAAVELADGPNGHDWMHPWKVVPVDGKPTIRAHKGGNHVANWKRKHNATQKRANAVKTASVKAGKAKLFIDAVRAFWRGETDTHP